MRNKIALVVGTAVMLLGMGGTQMEPPVGDAGCLICESWDTQHRDYNFFGMNDQHGGGGYHFNGSYGDCGQAHDIYAGGETLLDEVASGQKRLLAAYIESDDAVLNTQRRAVQVIVNGVVYAHIPLNDDLYGELLAATEDTKLLER